MNKFLSKVEGNYLMGNKGVKREPEEKKLFVNTSRETKEVDMESGETKEVKPGEIVELYNFKGEEQEFEKVRDSILDFKEENYAPQKLKRYKNRIDFLNRLGLVLSISLLFLLPPTVMIGELYKIYKKTGSFPYLNPFFISFIAGVTGIFLSVILIKELQEKIDEINIKPSRQYIAAAINSYEEDEYENTVSYLRTLYNTFKNNSGPFSLSSLFYLRKYLEGLEDEQSKENLEKTFEEFIYGLIEDMNPRKESYFEEILDKIEPSEEDSDLKILKSLISDILGEESLFWIGYFSLSVVLILLTSLTELNVAITLLVMFLIPFFKEMYKKHLRDKE